MMSATPSTGQLTHPWYRVPVGDQSYVAPVELNASVETSPPPKLAAGANPELPAPIPSRFADGSCDQKSYRKFHQSPKQ